MKGYWGKPEATAEAIPDGWFRTGDLAKVDGDGYFFIVGREKDLIIRGGYNVYPREIEEAIHEHQAVAEVAVIGIPHAELGEEVGAAVQLRPGATATPAELRAFARETGGRLQVPAARLARPSSCPRAPPARSSTARFGRRKTSPDRQRQRGERRAGGAIPRRRAADSARSR